MLSTITVDLVNGTKFHYLTGKFSIEGFKNVKLKLYYVEWCEDIAGETVLPINEFLQVIGLSRQDINLQHEQRYNFDCEINGISLTLLRGRLDRITDTEVELYFNDVVERTSKGYKQLGGDGGLEIYNKLVK